MKTKPYAISILSGALLLFLHGCGAVGTGEEALVSGVIQSSNGGAIENAVVSITSPEEFADDDVTDENGVFSFTLDNTDPVEISIRVSRSGFNTVTRTETVAPGVDITDLTIELTSSATDGGGGGEETIGGDPDGPAAIILSGVTNQNIYIVETGDQVSSTFTFVVQDSAGRPLNLQGSVDVTFNILEGPGGGETVFPSTASTNSSGQVRSSLFSGSLPGPVKIEALIDRDLDGDGTTDLTIRSTPVLLAIHNGFPDLDHFTLVPDKRNFEGYTLFNNRNTLSVLLGDEFSNPVKPGTVVYFESTGGVIGGSTTTNDDGLGSVDLISGNPLPNDAITGSGGRPGYATITASTVDQDDNLIERQTNIVFSTSAAVITVNPTTFDVAPNGGASFDVTITDLNGNPMAEGTTISVDAGGDMEVSGLPNGPLASHLFPGPGATEFNFSIRDTDENSNDPAEQTVSINVRSPSGHITSVSITGTRRKIR